MRQRPTRLVGVLPAPDEGNGTAKLPLASLNILADPPSRAQKKLRVSIALIDPKPLTRRSLSEMLATALPDYVMVAASSCEELLQFLGRPIEPPHLIIVYIRSAGVADTCVQNALGLIRLRLPDAPIIVLSDRDDVDDVNEALICGARGYIPTSVEAEVAFAALRLINAGGTFIPASLRSAIPKPDTAADGGLQGDQLDLTPREFSVLDLLREGKPNKLIATELRIEESTVKVHVRSILKKLHAANRTHAACVANRLLGGRRRQLPAFRPPMPNQIHSPGTPKR
jgi:DNA-binding NarL/FixJ family response regulator